jgi:hypothetical protein
LEYCLHNDTNANNSIVKAINLFPITQKKDVMPYPVALKNTVFLPFVLLQLLDN